MSRGRPATPRPPGNAAVARKLWLRRLSDLDGTGPGNQALQRLSRPGDLKPVPGSGRCQWNHR